MRKRFAFGEVNKSPKTPATNDLRFPGKGYGITRGVYAALWVQLQNGLAYNWHRHYDASLGRYGSFRSARADGDAQRWADTYNYAGQRPG